MTLWSVQVQCYAKSDGEWYDVCYLESGRYLFDSIESVKAEAERVYGPGTKWEPVDSGDWWADIGDNARLVASWVEGSPSGGRAKYVY